MTPLIRFYRNPSYYLGFRPDEDELHDFILYLIPRLEGIQDRWRGVSSFDTYLASCVRLLWRRFLGQRRPVPEQVSLGDSDPSDTHDSFDFLESAADSPRSLHEVQLVLACLLLSFDSVSAREIDLVSQFTDVSVPVLHGMLGQIAGMMGRRLRLRDSLVSRIHACYDRYYLESDSRSGRLLSLYRERLGCLSLRPSNRMVEDVLGLRHGSLRRILSRSSRLVRGMGT